MGQEATVGTVSRSKPRLKEIGLYGQYELELSTKVGFLVLYLVSFLRPQGNI